MIQGVSKGQDLYKTAKTIISGGTGLLSKRPEMFAPDIWPPYYSKAKGCKVWDMDNNKFIDMSYMGIGACILGYADRDVNASVEKAISNGSMATLNCAEEVELAKKLCNLHSWAAKVKYARTGGEAMAIAVRIARARTDKALILFCGYHGWHDWYLSANIASDKALDGHLLPGLKPKGVPRSLKGTAIPFDYNNTEEFLLLIERYKGEIAAVVMEPIRNHYPRKGFLETIRQTTREQRIVLIFDEVTSGWRLAVGGVHLKLGIEPDIAVFAKGMSNGFPMAAILGKGDVMEAAQDTFISSTYWTEKIGPVSSLATIRKLEEKNVPQHLGKIGAKVQEGWKQAAEKHKLSIEVGGVYPLSHFSFNFEKPLVLKTLFTQQMLEKGFLATTAFYASYAHKEDHVKQYLKAVDEVFDFISDAIKNGEPEQYLKGPVCHKGFKRLT